MKNLKKITDAEIYQLVIDELQTYKWGKWICNSLNRLYINEKIDKETLLRLEANFENPNNIPEEFRGENWHGTESLWKEHELEMRVKYLQYLIKQENENRQD